jgi:hypothetical protein
VPAGQSGGGRWTSEGTDAGASESVTKEYFETGPGKKLVEGLTARQKADVIYVMTQGMAKGKVKLYHLEGLEKITTDAPIRSGDWRFYRKGTAEGCYDLDKHSIHLRTDERGEFSYTVLSHELGHHITTRSAWRFSNKGTESYRTMYALYNGWTWSKPSAKELGEFALRDYSMTTFEEFQADVWLVHQYGGNLQRKNLANALGVDSLDQLFER